MKRSKKENAKLISVRFKLLSIIIPIVTISILGLLLLTYNSSKKIIEKSARNTVEAEAAAYSNQISGWAQSILAELESFKLTLESLPFEREEEIAYMKNTVERNPSYPTGLYIGSESGDFLDPSGWVPDDDYVVAERDWFKEGLKHEKFTFGNPYFDVSTKNYTVSASVVLKQKKLSGKYVVAADINLDYVSKLISDIKVMDTGRAFLVNKSDMAIIAHADKEMIAKTLGAEGQDKFYKNVAQKIAKDDASKINTFEEQGDKATYMIDCESVQGTDWVLVSYIEKNEVLKELYSLQTFTLAATVVCLIILGICVSIAISYIIKPVGALTDAITKISKGDFTVQVNTKGRDEISVMGRSMQRFIANMRGIISEISQSSEQLNNQAENSSSISENLYSAASSQSIAMDELAETVNELARANAEIAENATNLATIVSSVSDNGVEVGRHMSETVEQSLKGKEDMVEVTDLMENIVGSINDLKDVVNKVSDTTIQINSIVNLIGDIADETTLLSLNASIEAARSGEAGRGFAVVADQIGKLAVSSTEAVEKITKLTSEINELVTDTIQQTELSVKEINTSSGKIDRASQTFGDIFKTIRQTDDILQDMLERVGNVNEVAASVAAITEEQSAAAEEILATAEELASTAKNVTQNSQEVASDAENLSETSESLATHMKKFTI
ncbi:methyl-accepting chemotaxis protein [Anaerosacchariphilus polymeriproducens]|uniref:Methyl-accepting chemotaxis protein n=1 Tax=Anaerosacchariphilus polymeriproducens TaxID=1812858 RepID=A0A371AR53_9FIRM|nr:methyl-accepting chemotaxis protein [Anaerosacchariphilus polymeriproducens]RDU22055.1 methyl-accepting chemotaxis protein [Anaerosacchariphilus polymeriproducens]